MQLRSAFLAILLSILAISPALSQSVSREFDANPGDMLEVDARTGGAVRISSWNENKISVQITTDIDEDDFKLRFISDAKGLRVLTDYEEKQKRHKGSVDIEFRVPRRMDLEIRTLGGEIRIEGVEGKIAGKTMGGGVHLSSLSGTIDLSTMGGNMTLSDSDVSGKLRTMGGNISMENVRGNVDAKTMGGNVHSKNVQPVAVASGDAAMNEGSNSETRIRSMGGNIQLEAAPNGANLETMGGNISLAESGGPVRAETKGGNISLGTVRGECDAVTYAGNITIARAGGDVKAKTYAGDIEITLTRGADVDLKSLAGDVSLTVPEGAGFTFDIEIAYTQDEGRKFRIESDFPLEMYETEEWESRGGQKYKYLRATGSLGDGSQKVKIRTHSGNVILDRK